MKATEQYFLVVLSIMPYKVVLIFESVDEILKYDHSNVRYWAVLSSSEGKAPSLIYNINIYFNYTSLFTMYLFLTNSI